jgi:ATP-dependent RNA helicase DHX57
MKQIAREKLKARRNRTAFEEVEEDLRLSLHFQDEDSVKDAMPDQQLDFKQLLARYKGVCFLGSILSTPKSSSVLPTILIWL